MCPVHISISIQMSVYMSSLNNSVNIYTQYPCVCVCVCVYLRMTPESGSLVVLFTRQCRLLLNKNGLSMYEYESTRKLDSWI